MRTVTNRCLAVAVAVAAVALTWPSSADDKVDPPRPAPPVPAPAASEAPPPPPAPPRPPVAFVLQAPPPAPANFPPPFDPSVQRASVVVQLFGGGVETPVNPYGGASSELGSMAAALRSSRLIEAAAQKALDVGPDKVRESIAVRSEMIPPRSISLEVVVTKRRDGDAWPADAADRVQKALVESLRAALDESNAAAEAGREQQRTTLDARLAKVREELDRVRADQRKLRELSDPEYGDPRMAATQIQRMRSQVERQIASYRARLAALEPASGPLLAELQKLVALREQRVAELTTSGGAELAAAKAALEDAKAQLAATRATADGHDPARSMRASESAGMRAQIAEQEAKLADMDARLAKVQSPEAQKLLSRADDLQSDESALKSEWSTLRTRLQQLVAGSGPEPTRTRVVVIDGVPDDR
jgi:hypothetical protein